MNNADATLVAAYARSWTRRTGRGCPPWSPKTPRWTTRRCMSAWPAPRARCGRRAWRGDFVAVAMERSLEQLIAILGAMAAGACPCPLEPRLADEETARRVAAVGLAWMLHGPAHAGTAAASGLPAARLLPAERLALGEPACAPALAPDAPALLLHLRQHRPSQGRAAEPSRADEQCARRAGA